MADVSAKDGSQETLLNLTGIILSLLVVPLIGDSQVSTWLFFVIFVAAHLAANYLAVKGVHLNRPNRQRLSILLREYSKSGKILTPKHVAQRENVLHFDHFDAV
jgi:hypothetical protein